MYVNAAYLNNDRNDFVDIQNPLTVSACGTYRLEKRRTLSTQRPCGRQDYQLLYVAAGKAYFSLNGEELPVEAGGFVLYRPGQPQSYHYHIEDHPEVFWVHFTGFDVETILSRHGLQDKHVFYSTGSSELRGLFLQMIRELRQCKPLYQALLAELLQQLFLLLHRARMEAQIFGDHIPAEVESAVHYFNENYSKEICVADYAKQQHMSVSWFIRTFKRYTGLPPMQYILSLRMTNARLLLEESGCNVSEVAAIVGFENPLYFSRLFKKTFGISPAQYRKKDAL